jgi:hypothetical protein
VLIAVCYFLFRRSMPLAIWRWRSPDVKELEIAVLRHELAILRRQTKRPAMTAVDRLFLAAASRVLPRSNWRSFIITPDTLLSCIDAWWRNGGPTAAELGAHRSPVSFEIWCGVWHERTHGGAISASSVS